MIDVHYGDLPSYRSGVQAQQKCLRALRANGERLHLIYDRRIHLTRRPIAQNKYLLPTTITNEVEKVSIINENGTLNVVKEREWPVG